MMKKMWILLVALMAAAVVMVACGRNRNDADTTSQQSEIQETVNRDENAEDRNGTDNNGIVDDAQDLVSDVVDGGEEIVSDVIEGGRDVVSDIASTGETTKRTETTTEMKTSDQSR